MDRIDRAAKTTEAPEGYCEASTDQESGHEFSEAYRSRKRALIEEVERATSKGSKRRGFASMKTTVHFTRRAAALVAAICIIGPAAAWAATNHADFFAGAFGDSWRQSQPATQSFQDHGGVKPPTLVQYPASEVTQLDPEKAEALLGSSVCDDAVTVTATDGHQLTITTAVRSEHGIVYGFTLHRSGGVTCLDIDESKNNVTPRGIHPASDARFVWMVEGNGYVYVDLESSSDDTLIGYGYAVFDVPVPEGDTVQLKVFDYDAPYSEAYTADGLVHERTFEIPCTKTLASVSFGSEGEPKASVSPIGLVLDLTALVDVTESPLHQELSRDPSFVQAITLNFRDGQAYTVFDKSIPLDNMLASCCFKSDFSLVFNRLVDPEEVESIEVISVYDAAIAYIVEEGGLLPSRDELSTTTTTLTRL